MNLFLITNAAYKEWNVIAKNMHNAVTIFAAQHDLPHEFNMPTSFVNGILDNFYLVHPDGHKERYDIADLGAVQEGVL
jgi:hypothetical protein